MKFPKRGKPALDAFHAEGYFLNLAGGAEPVITREWLRVEFS
jgi:hypothetical protein